ncbi:MAG: hypothetical protein U1E53_28240 [Dongiaceae bacterium]
MSLRSLGLALAACVLAAGAVPAPAADAIRTVRVGFKPGASSATLEGSVRGYDSVDYPLGARAGQTMRVTLEAGNPSTYFNLLPPRSEEALFVGSTGGSSWTGTLPRNGDYRVRVYLMRNAARRNETSRYSLTVAIAGGPAGTPAPQDAKVAGTPYHATGEVRCAAGTAAWSTCAFGVIRGGPGNAEVHLTAPDGTTRVLRFAGERVTLAEPPGLAVKAAKQGDEWSVTIGDGERYSIPEAVIDGG